jgi:tetratricopeptide (TPR) repeat protein
MIFKRIVLMLVILGLFSRGASGQPDGNKIQDLMAKGERAFLNGESDRAIEYFTAAIELDPKLSLAHYGRGAARGQNGEFEKAVEDFTAAIRLDPKHTWSYHDRANAWIGLGNTDKALNDLAEALRLDPAFEPAFALRAWVRLGSVS